MQRTNHFFLLMAAVIVALVVGAVGPYSVNADDGVPATETPAEESATETAGEEAADGASVGETVEEPVSIPEVLEQAPEGTEVVIVNEEGDVLPLATEEAAEIVATSDPMWCPEGATPGDAGCTGSFGTFDELIDALTADAVSGAPVYTGNGVIWVQDTYNGNDDAQIEFDSAVLTNIGSNNLTVQGGWSGGNNTTVTGTSTLDVSLVFSNWGGAITLNDLDIAAGDGSGFGLLVTNNGDVTLDNVSVSNTTVNPFGFGDGALIASDGNVDIADSAFDDNDGNGLQVASAGTITLDTVSASGNALTGAYLDTCGYDDATGLCAGNGLVTITSATGNTFNDNGFIGLNVDSGGGLLMDHTQANNNSLDGAVVTSSDGDGTGNVNISQSDFSGNSNAYGLDVFTDGNINLTDVTANSNAFGAVLDTTSGTGSVSVSDSHFGDSALTGNTWSGLHIDSGASATLINVIASFNGTNGAYIDAQDDIYVENSVFNDNVHFNFPQDPGLYAKSHGGNITLLDVIADGNHFGAGAVLRTTGAGTIHASESMAGDSHFNGNGTFGIQATSGDGNITLLDLEASYNQIKGAYLNSYGSGDIFVTNSAFVENGSYGLYASADSGDVSVDTATVTGDDGVASTPNDNLTNVGAFLSSYSGNIFVTDSAFNLNTETGLIVVGDNAIDLVNVTADGNGVNGVEVYTTQTYFCREAGDTDASVTVNVDGGTFTNNGEYGILATAGPAGTLNFIAPAVFGGNGLGDYLLDLTVAEECPPEPVEEPEEDKPNIVPVPTPGNLPVEQDCDNFTSTIFEMPDGSWVNVGCPYEGFSNLESLDQANLPGPLGAGTAFVNGLIVSLTDADGNSILNEQGFITINFLLPEGGRGRTHSILYWDPTLNDGQGGWMKLPVFEQGTSFPLHPENPDDPRIVASGVQQVDNMITVTVNFPGTFVLTTP
ncbi:MAG: right-handed parallel beta-helix repeat-containing protein [Anaerolineales bacterium]|nr:right-handed parallel beta-helix repeat-containing protein [Chloroflexi bacterium CFX1]MCK6540435.1 right-handed parallel beta-helix repeat-containing protein [Anaerolineales bacterium]MCQ3952707.1 hypothetical protein [Chloroflexota bacterium]MDL1919210.1 right-handed parallel beta-helix repeat-containing protein [Chloroflexi bacterium CFX5]NUQ59262.1 right-handed parallel beta-helix repeat-containing protein [Anaerolineales bacterium]